MPRIRDFLNRFRPAGAPGAAARAAVPADRVAEQTAELAPVFGLLADVAAEAEQIRSRAAQAAHARHLAAADEARRIVAAARAQADAARAAAFGAARASAEAAGQELIARARDSAEAVAERVAQRLPAYTALVVETAMREVGAEPQRRNDEPQRRNDELVGMRDGG